MGTKCYVVITVIYAFDPEALYISITYEKMLGIEQRFT